MKIFALVAVVVLVLGIACGTLAAPRKHALSPRVQQLLANLTLEQKVGQMTQLTVNKVLNLIFGSTVDEAKARNLAQNNFIGSFLNTPTAATAPPVNATDMVKIVYDIQRIFSTEGAKIPILYGVDSVHGANQIAGATLFPHQINAGAALNPALSEQMASITAKDTRAVGVPWTFAPILDIAQHPGWPRMFESFGEDPKVAAVLGAAMIRGYQGGDPPQLTRNDKVAACMKHFIGYGSPRNGQDRTTSYIPDRQLRQYHVPPFQAAVDAGVSSAMECYNDVNGEPVVASNKYLRKLLRDEMGFNGLLVTDWAEILDLVRGHRTAATSLDAARVVLQRTSVDLSMVALELSFFDDVVKLVREGVIAEDRIDESAGRVLQLKEDLGLLDNPLPDLNNPNLQTIGSREDRDAALALARESIVLLENPGKYLPINLEVTKKIFLVGPSSSSLSLLCGGWTVAWQGSPSDRFFRFGITVLSGIQTIANEFRDVSVTHQTGFSIDGEYTQADLDNAIAAATSSEVTIVAMGEDKYAEGQGNLADLSLPAGQLAFLRALIATGKPVVVVLIGGRPRLLNGAIDGAAAVINALLPCLEGGQAIAEVIFGFVNPSGKMPVSYPKNHNQVPMQYYFTATSVADFQWPFGHGLSYSTFVYSGLTLSSNTITAPSGTIDVSVTLTNQGPYAGKESVLFFLKDDVREVTPEDKLLWAFEKVYLEVGASVVVRATVTIADLSFYGVDDTVRVIEAGTHQVIVSTLTASFTLIV